MTGAYRATFSFYAPPKVTSATIHRFRLSPLLSSSVSIPFPSKRTNRKNHLRPKILKTLTKPFTPAPLPQIVPVEHTVPIPIPFPPDYDPVLDAPSDEISSRSPLPGEKDRFEEFGLSETIGTAGEYSGINGKIYAKSLLKFCGYLVGVTIFAVWVLGNSSSSKKEERVDNLAGKGSILLNGSSNVAYFDDIDQEERISEIRAMAREAREKEKRERKEGNEETDIEKEIGARLVKLEKRLNSKREKLPESFMNYLGLFGNEEEEEEELSDNSLVPKEDHKALRFKKKFKFKSPSMNSRSSPKGFSGSNSMNGSHPNGESRDIDSGTMKIDSGGKVTGVQLNLSQDGNKLETENKDLLKEIQSGAVQENRKGRLSSEVTKSWKSTDFEKQNSLSLTKENQRTNTNLDGPASPRRKSSRDPGKRPVTYKMGDKKSVVQTKLWWLKLPYALAILMRRGTEQEGPAGLYALRTPSQADNQEDSCTVAFEDRSDANNFCYLLESYFQDLGNFSADIVPLSIKELHDAVKSRSKKVIVVKKGQLKLYAGQPFAEVEMALLSLLDQDQEGT
ncbi:hypothetical protein P3X46_005961 [Hevea brasiliensis]|uniref:Uncharacterized protein n=1 Tax=Hevea brasiliensis TaxID=3981 RepID=A0ABQ9MRB0_HEVBR|nr:uncharacterized protein LOC110633075 [Hevea brasiliensis]KAJ9181918.1 hypothetical protein P3X46_005961 [Hevea brasiliensis]